MYETVQNVAFAELMTNDLEGKKGLEASFGQSSSRTTEKAHFGQILSGMKRSVRTQLDQFSVRALRCLIDALIQL